MATRRTTSRMEDLSTYGGTNLGPREGYPKCTYCGRTAWYRPELHECYRCHTLGQMLWNTPTSVSQAILDTVKEQRKEQSDDAT